MRAANMPHAMANKQPRFFIPHSDSILDYEYKAQEHGVHLAHHQKLLMSDLHVVRACDVRDKH
jgi:hypothetical protein